MSIEAINKFLDPIARFIGPIADIPGLRIYSGICFAYWLIKCGWFYQVGVAVHVMAVLYSIALIFNLVFVVRRYREAAAQKTL